MRKSRALVAALATAIVISVLAVPPGVSSADAADVVTQWNLHASNALMVTAGQPPQQSVPHLAMVHGAIFDAVNAIDGSYEGYLLTSDPGAAGASVDAAAATAAHDVLLHLVPLQEVTLAAHYAASLAAIDDGDAKVQGVAVGRAAAAAMITARTDDGRFGPFRFAVGSEPGQWRPVPPAFANDPNAWLKDVEPFLIRDPSQFRSNGPLSLRSRQYAREYMEVKDLGSATSATRTVDQTNAARYWAENPPATWSRILRTLATQHGLDTVDSARMYARVYLAAADALISVWDDKARWSFWRPITAIREADTDRNARTHPDAAWVSLIPNPPYPEHPSGHTGLSGAIVATLQDFFGTDDVGWTDTNNGGLTRDFTSLSDAIDEIVDARVWSGIHFRTADEHGARIGERVARWGELHYFDPVNHGRGMTHP